jgi:hypothetical protein
MLSVAKDLAPTVRWREPQDCIRAAMANEQLDEPLLRELGELV